MLRFVKLCACVSVFITAGMFFLSPAQAHQRATTLQAMENSAALTVAGQGDKPQMGF